MNRENVQIWLWIFCIVVMTTLTLKLWSESSVYDCGYCTADFTTKQVAWEEDLRVIKVPMQELFKEWKNGRCLVRWDKNTGFQSSYELLNFSE